MLERMAQLAWTEQGLSGSKFVCTVVLQKLSNNPQAGKWSTCMYDSAVTCDPNTVALKTLVKVWNELSDPMHGQSFSGLAVQVLDRVSAEGKCLLKSFCEMMGLPHSL